MENRARSSSHNRAICLKKSIKKAFAKSAKGLSNNVDICHELFSAEYCAHQLIKVVSHSLQNGNPLHNIHSACQWRHAH